MNIKEKDKGHLKNEFGKSPTLQKEQIAEYIGENTKSDFDFDRQSPAFLCSRPSSSVSNYSWYSVESDFKEHELRAVIPKLSTKAPINQRISALTLLIKVPVVDLVNSELWSQMEHLIRECLVDKDMIIFKNAAMIVHNLIVHESTLQEGFLNVLEACLYITHKKSSPNNKIDINTIQKAIPYYGNYKNTFCDNKQSNILTVLSHGVDLNNMHHQRLLQLANLIFIAQKECIKYWLRWKENKILDMMENYMDFIIMQIENFKVHKDKLNLLYIMTLVDPYAIWLDYWMNGNYISQRMLKIIKKNNMYSAFLVHTILENVMSAPNIVCTQHSITDHIIHDHQIKLSLFLHCLHSFGKLLKFKKMHAIFPIVIRNKRKVTLEMFIIFLVRYLNESRNISSINHKEWYQPVEGSIVEVLNNIFINNIQIINSRIIFGILEPLEAVKHFNFTVPRRLDCLKIMNKLAEIEQIKNLMIQKLTWETIPNESVLSTLSSARGGIKGQLQIIASEDSIYPVKSINKIPLRIISIFMNKLIRQCNLNQEIYNPDMIIDLLNIVSLFNESHSCMTILSDNSVIYTVLECYKFLNKQIIIEHNSVYSDILNAMDSFLVKFGCLSIGMHTIQAHKGVFKILIKRLIHSSEFWGNDLNLNPLLSHAGQTDDVKQAFDYGRLLRGCLLKLWRSLKSSHIYGFHSHNVQIKLTQLLSTIQAMACNLNVLQLCIKNESHASRSGLKMILSDTNLPSCLTELLDHVSKQYNYNDGDDYGDSHTIDSPLECECVSTLDEISVCFVALLVIRALSTNLDISLYLNCRYRLQENLLLAQDKNIVQMEESDKKVPVVVVDELSLLRHQILLSSYYIGGSDETAPKSYDLDMYLKNEEIPRIFSEWPEVNIHKTNPSTNYFGRRNFLEEFLRKSRATVNMSDALWIKTAIDKLRMSIDIKNSVMIDLLYSMPKAAASRVRIVELAAKAEYETVYLFAEDYAGIELIVRYGLDIAALKDGLHHARNLSTVLQMSYYSLLNERRTHFQGFDWFVGVAFLACKGHIRRSRKFLQLLTRLPCAPFIWQTYAATLESQALRFGTELMPARFALMKCIEVILEDMNIENNVLQYNGISWTAISHTWLLQCYLNILNWPQIVRFICCCILYQPDFLVYFSIVLLTHLSRNIMNNSARNNLWDQIKLTHLYGFSVEDYFPAMDELRNKYSHILLPLLQSR